MAKTATKIEDHEEPSKPLRKALHASPDASAEALEQADEYDSIFGTTPLELNDGTTMDIPPHPDYGMLDDDQIQEYDELLFDMDTKYDREEDIFIPEQRLKDSEGVENGIILPATTQPGAIKRPFRINGELVRPQHGIRVVQIALGPEDYKKLREGGRAAKDVWRIWGEQSMKIKERAQRDSKSAGGPVGLAAVPSPDSE